MACCPATRCAVIPHDEYSARGDIESAMNGSQEVTWYTVGKGKNVVVMIHDILGKDVGRHYGICDTLADELDCRVVCPDLLRDDVATQETLKDQKLLGELLHRHTYEGIAEELSFVYDTVLKDAENICLIGFCWGSWVIFHEGANIRDSRVKAAACFHPSVAIEAMLGGSIEDLIKNNKLPMVVAPCWNDRDELKPGGLLDNNELYSVTVFDKQDHGFMTQADAKLPEVKKDVEKGLEITMELFSKYFGPQSCCPPTRCALVPKADYSENGDFLTLKNDLNGKDLRYYTVGSGKNAIVVINDVFGLDSGRHLGICDDLARMLKCTVICPDLFRGDLATFDMLGKPEFVDFVRRHPLDDVNQDLECVYKNIIGNAESICVVGFCWGCWVAFSHDADPRVRAGACFHPALGIGQMLGAGTLEDVVSKNKLNMLVMPCSDDPAELKAGGILDGNEKYQVYTFEEENHGFMTQGDISNEKVKDDVIKGMSLARDFFSKYLPN